MDPVGEVKSAAKSAFKIPFVLQLIFGILAINIFVGLLAMLLPSVASWYQDPVGNVRSLIARKKSAAAKAAAVLIAVGMTTLAIGAQTQGAFAIGC